MASRKVRIDPDGDPGRVRPPVAVRNRVVEKVNADEAGGWRIDHVQDAVVVGVINLSRAVGRADIADGQGIAVHIAVIGEDIDGDSSAVSRRRRVVEGYRRVVDRIDGEGEGRFGAPRLRRWR